MRLLLPTLLLLVIHASADNIDLDLNTDKSGWVDLLDPFAEEFGPGKLGSNQKCDNHDQILAYQKHIERLIATNEQLRNKKTDSVDVLLKHILRQFLVELDVELTAGYEVDKLARVYLSPSNVDTVIEYLNSQKHLEEVALRERLRTALESFVTLQKSDELSVLFTMLQRFVPLLMILNVIFLPIAIFNVMRRIAGPRHFLGLFLVGTFILSFYFTYIRKYQEVLASRFQRVQNTDDACSPKGLISEAFGVLLSYVRIKGKDKCLQKYEDMLVEPFLLVDPLQVFGEVVTNFLMSPFSVVGIHLNKFFNDFFVDTPIMLSAVKLIIIVLVLFYLSGYRIRTIFATIEPAPRQNVVVQNEVVDALPPTRPHIEETIDISDTNDLPSVANLDDSNVTRRRQRPPRSKSLPRGFQRLALMD